MRGRLSEHQEGRENTVEQKLDKYSRLSFCSWVFQIMFGGRNKNYMVPKIFGEIF